MHPSRQRKSVCVWGNNTKIDQQYIRPDSPYVRTRIQNLNNFLFKKKTTVYTRMVSILKCTSWYKWNQTQPNIVLQTLLNQHCITIYTIKLPLHHWHNLFSDIDFLFFSSLIFYLDTSNYLRMLRREVNPTQCIAFGMLPMTSLLKWNN